jgi:hypothetical protein
MNQVKQIWQEAGYPAAARLWALVKQKGLGVSAKEIKEFVDSQEVMQLHKKAPVDTKSNHITSAGNNLDFQADLLDMTKYKRENGGNSWILLVEDIFNRTASMKAIRTKSPTDVVVALEEAFEDLGMPKVSLTTDQGNEFKGACDKLLENSTIAHLTAEVGDHRVLGLIDSLSRFVKNALHKHFTHSQTTNWINYLPTLEKNYNDTPHTSLKGMTPNEAKQRPTDTRNLAWDRRNQDHKQMKFSVGQTVRTLKRKQVFGKGYEVRYSIPVYTVESIDGMYYVLSNGKRYREHELQAVVKSNGGAEAKEEREESAAAPTSAASAAPVAAERRDVAREAHKLHRTDQILTHKEGISQQNRRPGLRERKPEAQVEDVRYGKVRW